MRQPLVSIIIPSYNRAQLISETLYSVISQTYTNWECIIVDDNSTDETLKAVSVFYEKDSRFKFIVKSEEYKQGAGISRNIGLKMAVGDYIQFLDCDDILGEKKLEEQLNLLLKESEHAIATCKWGKFDILDENSSLYENKEDYKDFNDIKDYFDLVGLQGGFFPSHSFLISKKLINFSGYWNENLTLNDDGEFFFRILSNSTKILFCEKAYVLYRNNSNNNLSTLNSIDKAISLLNSWRIIETLYVTKYKEIDSVYINKKKSSVYNELKKTFPKIISKNSFFFKQQIKNDTLFLRLKKLKKRIINRLKIILGFNICV